MADRAHPLTRPTTSRDSNRRARFTLGGLLLLNALAVLEVAWLWWYLVIPLPNAANIGGTVKRWILLSRALPEVVPGVEFEESYFGLALAELSHVENLLERVPIVLTASLIAASAASLGSLALRALRLLPSLRSAERALLAFGLGLPLLGVLTMIAGRPGLIGPWPVRIALGLPIVAEAALRLVVKSRSLDPPTSAVQTRWLSTAIVSFLVIAGPFLALMALGAMLPTIDFDSLEYHLQGPKEYYLADRIMFLEHNVYTSMPFGVEMLSLLGMEVLDDWWRGALVGQLLVMLHAPLTALAIALTVQRIASLRAAWVAAVVYVTTPWVYRLAVIPYVEGPLCFYHATLIWAVVWDDEAWKAECAMGGSTRRRAFLRWVVLGTLAGGAMACKYPALISAVIPFGLIAVVAAVKRRAPEIVLAFVAGWAVVMGPWLIKNVMDTGNPVYPLGYAVFGGRDWSPAREAQWNRIHGPKPITLPGLVDGLLDVAGRSDWQSALFTALAPLALLRPGSRKAAGLLTGYAVYLFATWWLLTHRLDRFWLPILPALAMLAGIGSDWTRWRVWTVILALLMFVSILTNLTFDTTALAGLNQYTTDYATLRENVPAAVDAPLARLDAMLPDDSKVLLVGQASVFPVSHAIVYNTVFDDEQIETIARDRSPEQILDELHERKITHVYVDWFQIRRYRSPGNYGFTPFVTPELFDRLVRSGVLEPPTAIGAEQDLYRVRSRSRETGSGRSH